jgi:EAL domain-containing protein (putative c-di-GMP-specific phosphodiesterase class I)
MHTERQRDAFSPFDTRLQDLICEALARDPAGAGFDVHYQPIVRVADGSVVAVEALARWHPPEMREVAPPVFISVAERCGLIGVLDDFVLNRACASAQQLSQTFGRDISVHVNISARRLGRMDLEATVAWAVRRHRLEPSRLVLELTENGGSADVPGAAEAVSRIRTSGVSVALDDCSASVNVLRQLHTLPIDVIKLDAMLLGSDDGTWRAEAVCRSIMEFSRQLSLKVIAEGVETVAQARWLPDLGCEFAQGYLYAPPLPVAQLGKHRQISWRS